MTFINAEIDTKPALGWVGGPSIDILVRKLANGAERRNDETGLVTHTFTLPFNNVKDPTYLEYIKSAFLALRGKHKSFLTKDYGDFRHGFASNSYAPMQFATGDGVTTAFQLKKTYTFGPPGGQATWSRKITKPRPGAVIYVNEVVVSSGVAINLLTGMVTFSSPPPAGAVIAWVGEFRVCVRFDEVFLPSTIDNKFSTGEFAVQASLTLVEVDE